MIVYIDSTGKIIGGTAIGGTIEDLKGITYISGGDFAVYIDEAEYPDIINNMGEYVITNITKIEDGNYHVPCATGTPVYTPIPIEIKLANAQQAKLLQLQEIANANIQTFKSSALGTPHTYLSDAEARPLLDGEYAYVKGNDYKGETLSWYTIEEGYKDHTGAQFSQVWLDGRANMRNTKEKADEYEKQIMAPGITIDQVNNIKIVFP